MIALAKECCEKVNPEIGVFTGRVVSGDQFISDKEKKKWLTDTFAGYCTEMEGAAIAQVCYFNHIPFLIVRAISDKQMTVLLWITRLLRHRPSATV